MPGHPKAIVAEICQAIQWPEMFFNKTSEFTITRKHRKIKSHNFSLLPEACRGEVDVERCSRFAPEMQVSGVSSSLAAADIRFSAFSTTLKCCTSMMEEGLSARVSEAAGKLPKFSSKEFFISSHMLESSGGISARQADTVSRHAAPLFRPHSSMTRQMLGMCRFASTLRKAMTQAAAAIVSGEKLMISS